MLTRINQFWKFKNSTELDEFLNSCIESEDEYQLSSYGLSSKGDFYAYGSVVIKTKFGKKAAEKQEKAEQSDVTTF